MGKRRQPPTQKKTPKSVVEAELCELLKGNPSPRLLESAPPFPHKFCVVRPSAGGAPIILKVADNAATITGPKFAAGFLRDYVSYLGGPVSDLNITFDACVRIIDSWSHQTFDLVELPKVVAFKSDPELCMTRLPFDPVLVDDESTLEAHAPFFAEMLSRTQNSSAFVMRIGSLFDPLADRKQAVWMSGPPDCGKSEFAWLLMELAGKSYGILSNDDLNTNYWKAQLVGKRVGIVQEAAARFLRSDQFKAITGDDQHSVNQKNVPIFYAKMAVMMFFFSNNPPEVPHDEALLARIIDCRIAPIPKTAMLSKAIVRQKLTEEFPYIAGYCASRYQSVGSGDRIPCGFETLLQTIENYEADYLDFLDHHFIADKKGRLTRRDFRGLMIDDGIKSPTDQAICKRVLLSRFAAEERRCLHETNADGVKKRAAIYEGVRKRTEAEKQFISVTSEDMASSQGQVSKNKPQHIVRIK